MPVSLFNLPSNATSLDSFGAIALYAIVIGFIFVECALLVGFLFPGDTLLFGAGLLAANPDRHVDIAWLITGVLLAAIVGEMVGYFIGLRAGMTVLRRRNGRFLNEHNLAKAEAFYRNYGVLAILLARWIPWARTFAPLLAGAVRMPWPKFLAGNIIGALAWCPVLLLLGYFAASIPALKQVSLILAPVLIVGALVAGYLRYRKLAKSNTAENRDQSTVDPAANGSLVP